MSPAALAARSSTWKDLSSMSCSIVSIGGAENGEGSWHLQKPGC